MRFVRVHPSTRLFFAAASVLVLAVSFAAVHGTSSAGEGTSGSTAGNDLCSGILKNLASAPPDSLVKAYGRALENSCRPLPAAFWTAMNSGKWNDQRPLTTQERTGLLGLAAEHGYSEAETLIVSLVEGGRWPDGADVSLEEGGILIRALHAALTPYRVRLLLDVWDQQSSEGVRLAVLTALSGSKSDEALLPALDAFWNGMGPVQQAGYSMITNQPEKAPIDVLARLIRKLPQGGLLDWALHLAKDHSGASIIEAKKARGI